jgi:PAS domain S-box-containing protein
MFSILYVDDEPDLLELGRIFLEREGDFSVETSESAHAALGRINDTRFDVIVSDYQMPEMDGITFLKMVRSADGDSSMEVAHRQVSAVPRRQHATPGDTPFILFTGRGREEVVIEAINSGVDFYIQKGGEPKSQFIELGHKIRQAIRRKTAEDALKKNEERLRFALEGANDGLWDVTLATGEVYLSPRGCEILGYTFEELPDIAKNWSILVHPLDMPETQFQLARYKAGGAEVFEVEQRLRMKSGDWKWVLTRGKIVERDAAGNPVRMTGTHTDITGRKKIEGDLIRAKKDWEVIFRAIGNPSIILDTESTVLEVNDAVVKKTGKAEGELKGLKCWQIFHGPDTSEPPGCCPYERLKTSGSLETAEMEMEVFGGTYLISCTPVLNDAGQLERVIHIAVDVTDKKSKERELSGKNQELQASYEQIAAAEEELKAQLEEIVRSEREIKKSREELLEKSTMLEALLDAIPDVIGVQDAHHNIIRYNQAGYALLGQTPQSIAGKKCHELIGHDTPCPICATSETYRTRKPAQVEKYVPELGIWLDVRSYPVLDSGGQIRFVIEHLRDITQGKRAEEALRESERNYRNILNSIQDVFYRTDAGGTLIFVSPSGVSLLGYTTADEMIGRPAADFYADPQERHKVLEAIRKNGSVTQVEVTLKRRDGAPVAVSTSSHVYYDANNNFAGVEGIFREVPRIREGEQILQNPAKK